MNLRLPDKEHYSKNKLQGLARAGPFLFMENKKAMVRDAWHGPPLPPQKMPTIKNVRIFNQRGNEK